MPQVSRLAPGFTTQALVSRDFRSVSLADYAGRWVLLFFYPRLHLCLPDRAYRPQRSLRQIRRRAAVDPGLQHRQRLCPPGLGQAEPRFAALRYPLLSDLSHDIARRYGVLLGRDRAWLCAPASSSTLADECAGCRCTIPTPAAASPRSRVLGRPADPEALSLRLAPG